MILLLCLFLRCHGDGLKFHVIEASGAPGGVSHSFCVPGLCLPREVAFVFVLPWCLSGNPERGVCFFAIPKGALLGLYRYMLYIELAPVG